MRKAGNTSTAVMAQRAPREVEADDAQRKLWRALDFYPTPPWAARAGIELIKRLDPKAQTYWEPACGEGHIAAQLRDAFRSGFASDIHAFGYGDVIDFLAPEIGTRGTHCDWLVTNPPFENGGQFVERGLKVARRGVALLCRLAFIESTARFDIMQQLTVLAPFAERVPMQLGSWDPKLGSATAYAWFIWQHSDLGARRIEIIAPGTKQRLWREDDAARFGARVAAPLLEGHDA